MAEFAQDCVEELSSVESNGFSLPFLFIAGYPRSGTTSLQNLIRVGYPEHIPSTQRASGPVVWWGSKHDVRVANAMLSLGCDSARVLVAVRPFLDAASSWLIMDGGNANADWVWRQVKAWMAMLDMARSTPAIAIPFEALNSSNPAASLEWISDRIQIQPSQEFDASTSWSDLHERGVAAQNVGVRERSNLPHKERQRALPAARMQIEQVLGPHTLRLLADSYASTIETK